MYASMLCVHVLMALMHMTVLVWTGTSRTVWNSIEGLIVLAYNSAPQLIAFKNCSSGIQTLPTVAKQVRVGTRVPDDGRVEAELVVCGNEDMAVNIVAKCR